MEEPDLKFLEALEASQYLSPTPTNLEKVAKLTSPDAAREAFTQWDLRKRGASKFVEADRMLFVREALEQASSEVCSRYHASLFPKNVLVTDLTAGIGGDLIALARRGPAIGFEIDPVRKKFAEANLKVLGLSAELRQGDGLVWLRSQRDQHVFADPARRVEGRRSPLPEDWQPDPKSIAELGKLQELCVIKLSPLLDDRYLECLGSRLEFISAGRECREALIFAGLTAKGGRYAVQAHTGESLAACPLNAFAQEPARFFFDADPAAIRAHCLGSLCKAYDLQGLADSNGYLTGNAPVDSVWLTSFQVLYEGSGDLKLTRRKLMELGSSTPVLKQRSTGLDLQSIAKSLRMSGSRPLVVACYLRGKKVRHVILETIQS